MSRSAAAASGRQFAGVMGCVFLVFLVMPPVRAARAEGDAAVPIVNVPMDFPGVLYVPADGLPHPGVLLLHGLEGGMAADRAREARQLAAHGFAALALCWFGCDSPGVPAAPQAIDLSRTYEAFRWFRSSSYVKSKPTAFYGVSRGAEQALVLAVYLSKHPEFCTPNAVIVHSPAGQLQAGATPTWTWQGDLRGLKPGSPILLDRYSGSLLVTHGIEDQQQSISSSRAFEQQLRASGTAVRTFLHSRDPLVPPTIVEPIGRGPVRADFHYFEGEGNVFDPAMDSVRMTSVAGFLQSVLGD